MTIHFKLDENLDVRNAKVFEKAGYAASTVFDESLQGADDESIANVCKKEGFCIITADEDFAQIIDYPPQDYAGIIVLRLRKSTLRGYTKLIQQVVEALKKENPSGRLWIVEPGKIRIYEPSAKKRRA